METDWIHARIRGLLPTPTGAAVFLTDGTKTLSLFIDPMVARALSLVLEGETPPRPLTHDLVAAIFDGLGVRVPRVLITRCEEGTYYATLCLEQQNELGKSLAEIDARPSDCLVLAAHYGAPILVAKPLWDDAEDMGWAMEPPP